MSTASASACLARPACTPGFIFLYHWQLIIDAGATMHFTIKEIQE